MATVRDIISVKGSQVLTVGPYTSVLNAALLMNEHKIGGLVVIEDGQIQGMFTERDILSRVVVPRLDPAETLVEEVMSREVVYCQPHTSLEEARSVLKNRRIRHLPVLDNGLLCGLISIGDLNAHQATAQEQTIHLLHEYLYGRV